MNLSALQFLQERFGSFVIRVGDQVRHSLFNYNASVHENDAVGNDLLNEVLRRRSDERLEQRRLVGIVAVERALREAGLLMQT